MQTRREFIKASVAGSVALALASCAPTSTTPVSSAPSTMAPDEKATINYWHVWGGVRLPSIDAQIAGFHKLHPNITVQHTLISQEGMGEKYLTAIAGGSPPDVIMIHGSRDFPAFSTNGALTALDDLMKRDKVEKSTWFESEYNTYVTEGKTFALPYATGTGFFLLFWNKDHFRAAGLDPERAPKNWTELKEFARKLTIRAGTGFQQIGFDPLVGGAAGNHIIREWTFLNGGNIVSKDLKKILYDSPEGLEALTWSVSVYDDLYGGFTNVRPIVGGPGAAPFRDAFQLGKVSMLVDGVFVPALLTTTPNLKYGVGLVPANDKNPKATIRNIVEGGWGYAIPRGVKNVNAAWEFLKWTTMTEGGNLEFFKAQDRPSPVVKFNSDPYFSKVPFWPVVQEAMQKSEYSPSSPVQAKLNQITVQMVEEALTKKKTPEAAIKFGATESQKALDDWWASRPK